MSGFVIAPLMRPEWMPRSIAPTRTLNDESGTGTRAPACRFRVLRPVQDTAVRSAGTRETDRRLDSALAAARRRDVACAGVVGTTVVIERIIRTAAVVVGSTVVVVQSSWWQHSLHPGTREDRCRVSCGAVTL